MDFTSSEERPETGDNPVILRRIAEKAVDVYPFMECEFVGW